MNSNYSNQIPTQWYFPAFTRPVLLPSGCQESWEEGDTVCCKSLMPRRRSLSKGYRSRSISLHSGGHRCRWHSRYRWFSLAALQHCFQAKDTEDSLTPGTAVCLPPWASACRLKRLLFRNRTPARVPASTQLLWITHVGQLTMFSCVIGCVAGIAGSNAEWGWTGLCTHSCLERQNVVRFTSNIMNEFFFFFPRQFAKLFLSSLTRYSSDNTIVKVFFFIF